MTILFATAFYGRNSQFINLQNNILANPGSGYSIYLNNTNEISSNFNNLYTAGNQLVKLSGTEAMDLETWQILSQQDMQSISVNPSFFSLTNLHTFHAELDGAATPLAMIIKDIDGEARDPEFPDIGADEFDIPDDIADLALGELSLPEMPFAEGEYPLYLRLSNEGTSSITEARTALECQ